MFLKTLQSGGQILEVGSRECIAVGVAGTAVGQGGFCGRSGDSDLYYAPYAVAVLKALGYCTAIPVDFTDYLRDMERTSELDWIHRSSLAQSWVLIGRPEDARRVFMAGPSLTPLDSRSTCLTGYILLLAAMNCRVLGLPLSSAPTGPGGGSVPETAAVVVLACWRGAPPPREAIDYLEACVLSEGGLKAGPAAPGGDLLSTATGLEALRMAGRLRSPQEAQAHARFVTACWRDTGLFASAPADPDPKGDTEYTFHALLALGALL